MTASSPYRYWLVNDDDACRELQHDLLQRYCHLQCTGSYRSADAALLELTKVMHPHLILMDVSLPGTDGVAAIPLVRALAPKVPILMLTTFTDPLVERAVLAAGASAYLAKWSSLDELVCAIEEAISKPVPVPIATQLAAPRLIAPRRSWLQTLQSRLAGILNS